MDFKTFEILKEDEMFEKNVYLNGGTLNESINKDINRIKELIKKARGDTEQEVKLARKMTRSIKDKFKAFGRYEASLQVLGVKHRVTDILAQNAEEMGFKINVEGMHSSLLLDELRMRAKNAYKHYRIPDDVFNPGNSYVSNNETFKKRQKVGKRIQFYDPWSLYFWNYNMLFHMMEGQWAGSRRHRNEWMYWVSFHPVYNPKAPTEPSNARGFGIMDPMVVKRYAIETEAKYHNFGKLLLMRNSKLFQLVDESLDMLTISNVQNMETATNLSKKFRLDINLLLAYLYSPTTKKSKVNNVIRSSHEAMVPAMINPRK